MFDGVLISNEYLRERPSQGPRGFGLLALANLSLIAAGALPLGLVFIQSLLKQT